MSQLTSQEKAKVFGMYLGFDKFRSKVHTPSILSLFEINFPIALERLSKSLVLSPLSRITNEDAVMLVNLRSSIFLEVEIYPMRTTGMDYGFEFEFQYASSRRRRKDCIHWSGLKPMQFQYLTSVGYAVPIFFAPNHWANGKTAIELGIAIDKNENRGS